MNGNIYNLGDCPALTYSPKSREHENRFTAKHFENVQLINDKPTETITEENAHNTAK